MEEFLIVTAEKVSPKVVSSLCEISLDDLSKVTKDEHWENLDFKFLSDDETEQLSSQIKQQIEEGNFRIVGKNDSAVWDKGWGEISALTAEKEFHPKWLTPQYFDHHKILRYQGRYIETQTTQFIYNYDQILRRAIFWKFLNRSKRIIELGCGTGNSQLILAELFPNAKLVASDWAISSQEIIGRISAYLDREIEAYQFNMLDLLGLEKLQIDADSSILTVHALEQLGGNHSLLLNALLQAKPKLCVHIEPIVDFYDANMPFDQLAIDYHHKRNYLSDWVLAIRKLEKRMETKIIAEYRLYFGDRYHEAYSVFVWRPL